MWSKLILFVFGKNTGKEILSSNYNRILQIIVAIFILLNLTSLISWIKMLFTKVTLKQTDNPNENGGVLTATYIRYLKNKLYTAMEGFGTDEKAINDVYIQISAHPESIYTLYNYFGMPKYAMFGAPMFPWSTSQEWDLRQWLKVELKPSDFSKWDKLFTSVGI